MDKNVLEGLQRSSKRSAIISLTGIIIFFGTFLWSTWKLVKTSDELTKMENKFNADQSKDRKLYVKDSLLRIDSINLAKRIDHAWRILDSLNNSGHNIKSGSKKIPKYSSPQVKDALTIAQNSLISITIYGYNVDTTLFSSVTQYLTKMRYSVVQSSELSIHPSWLTKTPTVIYYAEETKLSAERLAQELSLMTGKDFTYIKGNGRNIARGQEPYTIVIDFVL